MGCCPIHESLYKASKIFTIYSAEFCSLTDLVAVMGSEGNFWRLWELKEKHRCGLVVPSAVLQLFGILVWGPICWGLLVQFFLQPPHPHWDLLVLHSRPSTGQSAVTSLWSFLVHWCVHEVKATEDGNLGSQKAAKLVGTGRVHESCESACYLTLRLLSRIN